ncbi:3-oxoacyl-ACP synthase [Zobellia amurskyensis]|uniref:3-oxoacyl-ACP synthase n=1 Tax=Zobellia amurskyensis TaxID=248905 RepID=A0A7X2ZS45_9FLAO|nr:3-oxoacyl-ACP synthase [Zobellia amurskyensis]MUH35357.1 3-oxoacyl-ACP synthase [Zobellia amurskyensis]
MSSPEYYIKSYCLIRDGKVSKNGEILFSDDSEEFPAFIKSAYKHFETDYSKFFKMDNLSKLAFMGAEVLLCENEEQNTALVLSNRASSLDTDRKHQAAISKESGAFASPAVFVYTLPNICMGEISIRHKLYSENSFFIFAEFNPYLLSDYANDLLISGKANEVLCGWVDYDKGKYDAFLYVIAKKGMLPHNTGELTKLYRTK